MYYLEESNASNYRSKLWETLFPFYLNYAERVQFPFPLIDFAWMAAMPRADEWRAFGFLVAYRGAHGDALALDCVLCPSDDGEYAPSDLVNTNAHFSAKYFHGANVKAPSRVRSVAANGDVAAAFCEESVFGVRQSEGALSEIFQIASNGALFGALSRAGDSLFWANADGELFGAEIAAPVARRFGAVNAKPKCVAYNGIADLLVGTENGAVSLFDARAFGEARQCAPRHANAVLSADFDPKNEFAFCSNDSAEIVFWDRRNVEKRVSAIARERIGKCKFFGDGAETLIYNSKNDIEIFDLAEWRKSPKNGVPLVFGGHNFDEPHFAVNEKVKGNLVASADLKIGYLQIWQNC